LWPGDDETGRSYRLHRTVEGARCRACRRAASGCDRAGDEAGAVYAPAAELAAELLRDVLAQDEPRFEPQPEEGVTMRRRSVRLDSLLESPTPRQQE